MEEEEICVSLDCDECTTHARNIVGESPKRERERIKSSLTRPTQEQSIILSEVILIVSSS